MNVGLLLDKARITAREAETLACDHIDVYESNGSSLHILVDVRNAIEALQLAHALRAAALKHGAVEVETSRAAVEVTA